MGHSSAMSAFGAATSSATAYPNPNSDYTIPQTINDGVQSLSWSSTSNTLVAGSWDNHVRCWDVQHAGTQFNAVPKAQITHDGPVLCTSFSGVRDSSSRYYLLIPKIGWYDRVFWVM